MMLLFYSLIFSTILTQITYTFNVNEISEKLYRDISKNFNFGTISKSRSITNVLNPKYIKRVELELREKYGEKEVKYFRKMLNEFTESEVDGDRSYTLVDYSLKNHINEHFAEDYVKDFNKLDDPSYDSEDLRTARFIVKLIKHEFAKFDRVKERYITPNMARFSQIRLLSQDLPVLSQTDTPCKSQAGCEKLEMLMNLCSYIRGGVGTAYDIYATMIHVLGNMLSVLCGCIFVGPAQVCFLKNFPYTCRIPYPAFNQLYQATYGIWELVKITSNLCRIYGG